MAEPLSAISIDLEMKNKLTDIIENISQCLAIEKSYNLPEVCKNYNLEDGTGEEAFQSKAKYVRTRLVGKNEEFVLSLAKQLIKDYQSYQLGYAVNKYTNDKFYILTEITRRKLIEKLKDFPNLKGKLTQEEILVKSNLSNFIQSEVLSFFFTDSNKETEPLTDFLNNEEIYKLLDIQIFNLLEVLVHPIVRTEDEQKSLIETINKVISVDKVQLLKDEQISNQLTYKVFQTNGVKGKIKNLIFASTSYKPEIVISDALNNDLEIVKNADSVLIYDEPILSDGLKWIDLVKWWSKIKEQERSPQLAVDLKNRLFDSLDSKPERDFFNLYYSRYSRLLRQELPALIPQVYLHYDPYTIKKHGIKYLLRQRMDFLILFSNSSRIVIEIDGKQHYATDDKASPKKYSEMMKLDRELRFLDYEVYRLGGYELTNDCETTTVDFIDQLFEKHL